MNDAAAAVSKRIRRGMSTARVRLEDVLIGLRELPAGIDRAPVARIVERAIAGVLQMAELEVDHDRFFPTIDEVLRAAAEAEEALLPIGGSAAAMRARDRLDAVRRGLTALREASIDALVAMQDRRIRAAPAPAIEPPPEPFRASAGVPAVHAVLRAPPRVLVDLRPPVSADTIDDSEDVIDEPGDEPPPHATTPEDALLVDHARALARECLADIAGLSCLRAPLPDAPWINAEPFERRLLASLDALLALAAEPHHLPAAFNVFEEVQRYARDAPTIDPSRELARALTFAVTRGEHALRAVVLTLKQAHPETFDAYREALSLARHPATAKVMRELILVDPDPQRAALALDVLRFLRAARFADVVPLSAHPVASVRVSAIRALGVVPERGAAAELLVDALADEDDTKVAIEAAESLLRLGRIEGLSWVRHRIDAGAVEKTPELRLVHLRLLAIAGGRDDAGRFLHAAEVTPRDAILAGIFGHPILVPQLLSMLAAANEVRRSIGPWAHPLEIAAAQALERITGAGLRDAPREVSDYDFARLPAIFVETWKAWWEPRAAEISGMGKLRWGEPWTPLAAVRELRTPNAAEIRADLALELSITGPDLGFEPSDWVARQRSVLVETSEAMGSSPYPAGTFPEAWLRRV
ncbi:MAG: hypothetical protein QM820_01635 [Minicystis sp.]